MCPSISLAVVIAVLGGELIAAPVPKDKPPQSIEGKYTLLSVSSPLVAAGGGKGNVMAKTSSVRPTLVGPATISRTEIVLEGRVSSAAAAAFYGTPVGHSTMEYTLDPTKSPMAIDVETANLRGKKSKSFGVVEVVGDRVIVAIAQEGEERPRTTEEAEGVTVYYFQKAPPPPKTDFRIISLTVGKEADAEKELNKLAQEGYELVSTTTPAATDAKSSPTTVHFVLKRTARQP